MKYILTALILLSCHGLYASQLQIIEGSEAYEIYNKLPGIACQEYRLANYIVLTKYQTKSCSENQQDNSKWNCTVQFSLKNGKKKDVMSASCSREI